MFKDILNKEKITEIKENFKEESEIINTFNKVFFKGIDMRASDIHIEPHIEFYIIRFRIDGILENFLKLEKNIGIGLISRIKILTGLDIGEKRLPQDGRFKGKIEKIKLDFRVSTIGTLKGERCVIRILSKNTELSLENIGLSDENYEIIKRNLNKTSGIIIISGPTGSGKTTTIYSMLKYLNNEEKNILTIEDPVEYEVEGISQVQYKNEIGLSFSNVLRGFLRQDPDILFIGEIRDKETGEIAIRAALTGHLVLTTVHAKDAVGILERMKDLGLDMNLLINGILFLQSQRLLKRRCKFCENGCDKCNKGFKGRILMEEILEFDEKIRNILKENLNLIKFKEQIQYKNFYERGKVLFDKKEISWKEFIKECD
ncbi:GspE/PulE family protein [Cetobacterium sp. SF1]|uniref:GspE/PulE family protein n=1 Tax=Cetobacterium sp. SF1 TaxID=3417654 RepID=UPI003CF4F0A6